MRHSQIKVVNLALQATTQQLPDRLYAKNALRATDALEILTRSHAEMASTPYQEPHLAPKTVMKESTRQGLNPRRASCVSQAITPIQALTVTAPKLQSENMLEHLEMD